MKDKRKAQRIKAKLFLNYDLFKGERVRREASSEDISFTGMRIKILRKYSHELSKDQIVALEVSQLADISPFFVGGQVVWIGDGPDQDSTFVGILFNELNEFQKDKIAKYIHGIE